MKVILRLLMLVSLAALFLTFFTDGGFSLSIGQLKISNHDLSKPALALAVFFVIYLLTTPVSDKSSSTHASEKMPFSFISVLIVFIFFSFWRSFYKEITITELSSSVIVKLFSPVTVLVLNQLVNLGMVALFYFIVRRETGKERAFYTGLLVAVSGISQYNSFQILIFNKGLFVILLFMLLLDLKRRPKEKKIFLLSPLIMFIYFLIFSYAFRTEEYKNIGLFFLGGYSIKESFLTLTQSLGTLFPILGLIGFLLPVNIKKEKFFYFFALLSMLIYIFSSLDKILFLPVVIFSISFFSAKSIHMLLHAKMFNKDIFSRNITLGISIFLLVILFYQTDSALCHLPKSVYEAENLPRQTGEIKSGDGFSNHKAVLVAQEKNSTGFLCYGPYIFLSKGDYSVFFQLEALTTGEGTIARIEVTKDRGSVILARRELTFDDMKNEIKLQLDFKADNDREIEFRVYYLGTSDMILDYVLLKRSERETAKAK